MRDVPQLERVSLDDMDGFEFQRFVAHLFEKLKIGKTEEIRLFRDEGQDIRLRAYDGSLIVVECKHHPKGSVGRPTVQKLHSAIITAKAKKGFLVTTGNFSNAALNYNRKLGSLIQLVDARILSDMAHRAQIRLFKKGESMTVYRVIPPSQYLLNHKVVEHIVGNAFSHPNQPKAVLKTTGVTTHFIPAYLIEYNINETFSTTVGVIHRIHINRGRILLNGQTGVLIEPKLTGMITSSVMIENSPQQVNQYISSGRFKLGYSQVKNSGMKCIQQTHTQIVSYYGRNNQRYKKTCIPHKSRILIRSLLQVYVPFLRVSCKILTRHHNLSLYGTPNDVLIDSSDAGKCEVCSKMLGNKRLLCNSCGRISHPPSFFGHSYSCEICKKTICKICTYWTRKNVFFKKKLCENCAKKLEREGKKIRKMT